MMFGRKCLVVGTCVVIIRNELAFRDGGIGHYILLLLVYFGLDFLLLISRLPVRDDVFRTPA